VSTPTLFGLILAALSLGALAVVLDRVNFPQKKFRPQTIVTGGRGPTRDRTGAHIVNIDLDDDATPDTQTDPPGPPNDPHSNGHTPT